MAKDWPEAQQKEQAFWSRWADNSPQLVSSEHAVERSLKSLDRIGLALQDLNGKTVAEIGCGPYGVLLGILKLSESFASPPVLIGIDPLMDFYRSKIGLLDGQDGLQLYNAKAEDLPLPEACCDFVFCFNALDHVEAPAQVVQELHRITRPGGRCAVALHAVTPCFAPVRRWLRYIDTNHPHHLTAGEVYRLLDRNFDRVERTRTITLTEDHPSFGFRSLFSASDKKMALLRWGSTFVLQTVCFSCRKN
jgi:Methylase involved in ubiquinone/menaquinone biosynthesis